MMSQINKMKPNRNLLRIFLFWLFAMALYFVLIGKLFNDQIHNVVKHQQKIVSQSVRTIRIPSTRGRILSSDGTVLADNVPKYNLVFHISAMLKSSRPKTVKYIYSEIWRISQILGITTTITPLDIEKHINLRPALPFPVFEGLSLEEMAKIIEMPSPPEGMEFEVNATRYYPLNQSACHLLGWVGPQDKQRADDRKDFFYYQSDLVGRGGLEKVLDKQIPGTQINGLLGAAGMRLVLVNHVGYAVEELINSYNSQSGNSVVLTLDAQAQTLAESLLNDYTGAFVLIDAETGDILAAASNPRYNLNQCSPTLSSTTWNQLLNDPKKPLLNRALNGCYEPGSIIKPLVAMAILNARVNAVMTCDGAAPIGNTKIGCTGYHGVLGVEDALKHSCNDFFVTLGIQAGLEQLQKIYKSAGIGISPNLPIYAAKGVFPTKEIKQKTDRRAWTSYDTGLISIGHGKLTVTPLQVALYMAAIANRGKGYDANLIKSVIDPYGSILYQRVPKMGIQLATSNAIIDRIVKGMWLVVNSPNGTGKNAKSQNVLMWGKTGTAELRKTRRTWFAGFAKHSDGHLYSFAIFIDNGQSGGKTCAPLAKMFFDQWNRGGKPIIKEVKTQ